ncbi:MAG: 4'-phosphopantetheinyl transferase superfamily protein [Lachnospiraceae bacterium]|nr:4'-phosphopantetheinyl transferase superfamily protein [Lachnospiraceae bacterium]
MDIFVVRVSDIMGEFGRKEIYDRLPDFRRRAADECRNQADRDRSLTAGALLLFCMKKGGVSLEETPEFNENGKMFFPRESGFYVNLSHSGDYAACVVDTKEVGIDIERIRQYKENVARRICLPKEMQYLEGKKEEEKNRVFTKLWTRKESMAKLSGKGIALLLEAYENSGNVSEGGGDCIYTKTYTSISGYFLSVSSHEDHFPDQIILLSPESLGQWR